MPSRRIRFGTWLGCVLLTAINFSNRLPRVQRRHLALSRATAEFCAGVRRLGPHRIWAAVAPERVSAGHVGADVFWETVSVSLAALHSITSSARPSSESGNVTPSAFAVLRLMTSSTLVDCWTGRS